MNKPVFGVMDLGSNTFHLILFYWEDQKIVPVFTLSLPAKIGEGGFGKEGLLPEAMDRGIAILSQFKEKLDQYHVTQFRAFGTSALRQAPNSALFLDRVLQETGIRVEVISGQEEASLIFKGIQAAYPVQRPSMIVDIGGGSIEFILTNHQEVVWKTSLEIGGLRLMERFHQYDPLPLSAVDRMQTYFREVLLPVTNAVHQYAPEILIGSSGSFDTLVDMWWMNTEGKLPPSEKTHFTLPLVGFDLLKKEIVSRNESQRRELPGMIPLRSGMMPVAVVFIDHLIQSYHLREIVVSRYSLKEGACYTFAV